MNHSEVKKVLIANVNSPRNLGDLAMFTVLLDLVRDSYPAAQVALQSFDPKRYDARFLSVKSIQECLYSWAIFQNPNWAVRIGRVIALVLSYVFYPLVFNKSLDLLLRDFKEADVVVFASGGYFHAKTGLLQALNLLMQFPVFLFAKKFKKVAVLAPVSFGPFAYSWQRWLSAMVIRSCNVATLRENYSLSELNSSNVFFSEHKVFQRYDIALLGNIVPARVFSSKKNTIGFTIRSWLKDDGQLLFEKQLAEGLASLSLQTGAVILPIIQVNAPEYGEDDRIPTLRVTQHLKELGVTSLPSVQLTTLADATKVYGEISLLVGMRMHSNILAAMQGTPFVSISYEHKSQGITADIGLEEYAVRCQNFSVQNFATKSAHCFIDRERLSKKILNKISSIQKSERKWWFDCFRELPVSLNP